MLPVSVAFRQDKADDKACKKAGDVRHIVCMTVSKTGIHTE